MGITQEELARQTGVTRVLVSRALNNHPSVAASTRQRIQEAARQLGYTAQSNSAARSLVLQRYGKRLRHNVLAVMLSQFEGETARNLPHFAPMLDGLEREALERGLDLSLHIFRGGHVPHFIRERLVDGVISLGTTVERVKLAKDGEQPLVVLGQQWDDVPSLYTDSYTGIRHATRHLVDYGHRRIAYIGQATNNPTAEERLNGYRDVLIEARLPIREELIEATLGHPGIKDGVAGMERVLARTRDFTAVVCYNDTNAMGAIRALRTAGLRVPKDISVTGFDDVSEAYNFKPAITSLAFDGHAMGRRSVQLMEEIIARQANGESIREIVAREIFPVHLVKRASTRPLHQG